MTGFEEGGRGVGVGKGRGGIRTGDVRLSHVGHDDDPDDADDDYAVYPG